VGEVLDHIEYVPSFDSHSEGQLTENHQRFLEGLAGFGTDILRIPPPSSL
jgi:hypothetical protein